jgi:hypothetical protein
MRRDSKEYSTSTKFVYKMNRRDYERNKSYYDNVDKEFYPRRQKSTNVEDVIDRYSK